MEKIELTEISTEKLSDEYLCVNSCGIQRINERERGSVRKSGRVDYHILYIAKGICHLMSDGTGKK